MGNPAGGLSGTSPTRATTTGGPSRRPKGAGLRGHRNPPVHHAHLPVLVPGTHGLVLLKEADHHPALGHGTFQLVQILISPYGIEDLVQLGGARPIETNEDKAPLSGFLLSAMASGPTPLAVPRRPSEDPMGCSLALRAVKWEVGTPLWPTPAPTTSLPATGSAKRRLFNS